MVKGVGGAFLFFSVIVVSSFAAAIIYFILQAICARAASPLLRHWTIWLPSAYRGVQSSDSTEILNVPISNSVPQQQVVVQEPEIEAYNATMTGVNTRSTASRTWSADIV